MRHDAEEHDFNDANADCNDPTYTLEQFRKFTAILQDLERKHCFIPIRHCCNTAATIKFPEMHLDMVRVGIGLYGLSPFGRQVGLACALQPSMQFKTKVAWVKSVPAGQPIGYGFTYSPVSLTL
jgi:alanine racemase